MRQPRKLRRKISRIRNPPDEQQFPHDSLYHPSPAMKRLEKEIINEDFNPSKREQRKLKEILDKVDGDIGNENDT